jgi:glucose-6-phosphate-specific signal transduction histidine kinase
MSDMTNESNPLQSRRLIIVGVTCLLYVLAVFVLNVRLQWNFPNFGVAPMLVVAWSYGLVGGLIGALVIIPINFFFIDLTLQDPVLLGPVTLLHILLALTVGRLSDVRRQLERRLLERDQAELKSHLYEKELRGVISDQVVESKPMAKILETGICADLQLIQGDLSLVKEKFNVVADSNIFRATEVRVDEAIRDTRSLVFQLDPDSILELGFQGAITWLAEQARESYGISCELEDDGQTKKPEEKVALVILRAVRELLANGSRHGRDTQVKISVRKQNDSLQIILGGKGLDFDASDSHSEALLVRRVGLDGLKEDLSAVGGMLQIEPDEGRTRAVILAPLV